MNKSFTISEIESAVNTARERVAKQMDKSFIIEATKELASKDGTIDPWNTSLAIYRLAVRHSDQVLINTLVDLLVDPSDSQS
ncbi:hypothetical protein [Levyella massiliensis]|uniref:hypothetical protein n=1 Tax=Levyella massiliensis TaxID=938289 RepID=UPI003EBBE745